MSVRRGYPAKHGEAMTAARRPSGAIPVGEERPSRSVQIVEGHRALEFNEYTPALIGILYNRVSSGASRLYRATVGIGIAEWRTVGLLAARPGLPANLICEITGMDKAAVSRALASLEAAGYLDFAAEESDPRRKVWRLSEKGHDLHGRVLDMALAREKLLMTGISDEEIATFNALARRMLANLPLLDMSGTDESEQQE
jgi:DNA-binding MarR family transcriptional regulator